MVTAAEFLTPYCALEASSTFRRRCRNGGSSPVSPLTNRMRSSISSSPAAHEVFQIAVDASARAVGVGAALLAPAEAEIASRDEQAWLAVVPGNITARVFYERRGWIDAGAQTYLAQTGDRPLPVLVHRYVKPLRARGIKAERLEC